MSSWCDQLVLLFVTVAEGPFLLLYGPSYYAPRLLAVADGVPKFSLLILLALFLAAVQKRVAHQFEGSSHVVNDISGSILVETPLRT